LSVAFSSGSFSAGFSVGFDCRFPFNLSVASLRHPIVELAHQTLSLQVVAGLSGCPFLLLRWGECRVGFGKLSLQLRVVVLDKLKGALMLGHIGTELGNLLLQPGLLSQLVGSQR
jgi:hypothetical protein